ncbi:hypothetical protein [Pedobacter agri]
MQDHIMVSAYGYYSFGDKGMM